jgi:membrane protein implicated in regulation of membrane protease activity
MAQAARPRILQAVTTPLGFFVLALLIVETFLALVLIYATGLTNFQRVLGMWAGVGMFLIVVLAVVLLVWHRPAALTFDREAHLIESGRIPIGDNSQTIPPAERFSGPRSEGGG